MQDHIEFDVHNSLAANSSYSTLGEGEWLHSSQWSGSGLSTSILDTSADHWEANTAHFRRGPMASMARADSQPPCSSDTYLQDSHDLLPIPNDNGLSLSGNGSRTVAAWLQPELLQI